MGGHELDLALAVLIVALVLNELAYWQADSLLVSGRLG